MVRRVQANSDYQPRYPGIILDGVVPTNVPKQWRDAPFYKDWAAYVVDRDGKCQSCGTTEDLHAHHIEHATYNHDLRFYGKNGIALCGPCHMTFHNDYIGNTRKRCSAQDLSEFLRIRTHFSRVFLSPQLQVLLP